MVACAIWTGVYTQARSSEERGVAVFRRATSSRLSRTMASRMLISSEVPAGSLAAERVEREALELLENVVAHGAWRFDIGEVATKEGAVHAEEE